MVTIDCDKSSKNETEGKLSKGMVKPTVADSSSDESDYETSLADESLEMARSNGTKDAELLKGRSRETGQSYDGSGIRPEDPVGTPDLDSIDDVAPQLAIESEPRPEGHTRTPDAEEAPNRHENGRSGFWTLLTISVLIVASGIGIALILCQHDIEKTKLQNEKYKNELAQKFAQEREFRLLENEQKQTELAIKKVNQEIEAKKLENERLEKQHQHDENMVRLEYEKAKNETFLKVYEEQLTPRIVTRKKENSGFFGRSTETFEDVEIPINNLPGNVKRIVAGTSGKSWSNDEDEHD